MRSVPFPFLSKITLLWTRAREPGPVSPVKVDSPLPFPWTQRGEIYIGYLEDEKNRERCKGARVFHIERFAPPFFFSALRIAEN